MASQKHEVDPNELVKIKIHKDKNNSSDVFVSVNNYTAQIKRGEVVEVPYYVAKVIEASIEQDEIAADLMEKYARTDGALGLS